MAMKLKQATHKHTIDVDVTLEYVISSCSLISQLIHVIKGKADSVIFTLKRTGMTKTINRQKID